MSVSVTISDPRSTQAIALLEQSHAMMAALFPADSCHYLNVDELCAPNITFYIAHLNNAACGCGALADKGGYGEIKSMFVDPAQRGNGIGDAILETLIEHANKLELPALKLETGEILEAAVKLYEKHGFKRTEPFGDYVEDPHSMFMHMDLHP